jgi:hypothetical protein
MAHIIGIKPYLKDRPALVPSQQPGQVIRPGRFVRYPVTQEPEFIFPGDRPPEGWCGTWAPQTPYGNPPEVSPPVK